MDFAFARQLKLIHSRITNNKEMTAPQNPVVDVSLISLENENLNLAAISSNESEDLQLLGDLLCTALRENGFVYVAGHGVHQQFVKEVGRYILSEMEN